jgi:hypothetical protein
MYKVKSRTNVVSESSSLRALVTDFKVSLAARYIPDPGLKVVNTLQV